MVFFNSTTSFSQVYFIMLKVLLISTAAGVLGTLLGGVIAIFVRKSSHLAAISSLFAGGFMLAIVSFELIPEALLQGSLINVILSFVAGVIVVILANILFEGKSGKTQSSMLVFLAIAIHNFPEGLAIGGGEVAAIGITIAILIAIHNIPEGLALSLPILQSGRSCGYALLLSALAGAPTALGGVVGQFLSLSSPVFICSCLSLAAGSMTFVTFSDILPQGSQNAKTENSLLFTSIGFLSGFIACAVL